MLGKRLINSNSAAGATCTTDTLQILGDTSCVAYYKMSDATDESGNYDGTPTNVDFNVAGKFGNAGSFNGTSSKINTSYIQTGQVYSTSFWGKGFSAASSVLRDTPAAGGANTFMDIATGANGQVILAGNAALDPLNTPSADWTHYAIVLDGTNATIFTNGTQTATRTYTAKTGNNGTPVHIMSNGAYSAGFGSGKIDQIRIFNKAITSTEVTTLYNEVYCQPTIVPTDYFEPVIYTGNGSTQSITSLNFAPDLTWVKTRSLQSSHVLRSTGMDSTYNLASNSTAALNTAQLTGGRLQLDSNGFTVRDISGNGYGTNGSSTTQVAWNWKAGGADVLNQEGTIDSQVSASVDSGFSIVKHTAPSSEQNYTIGHGLSQKPDMVILKGLDSASGWFVWHKDLSQESYYLYLNGSFGESDLTQDTRIWGQQSFTDSVISTRSNYTTQLNQDYIAYCFHSVEGMSRVNSYVGTGASGNSIVTGFRPAYVMIKRTDTSGHSWLIYDNKRDPSNPVGKILYANTNQVENPVGNIMNFLSNGFELITTNTSHNANGDTYIFMAFAEENVQPEPELANSFNTVTYTGNGGTQSIDTGFKPDLVWFKERNGTNAHQLYDTVRGDDFALYSNLTDAEFNYSTHPSGDLSPTFLSNGFQTPSVTNNGINRNTGTYVAWCWKASNDSTINQDGSITSIVSSNPASGFSVVKWTGSGADATIGHGISTPELIIAKRTDSTGNWAVQAPSIGNGYLLLNSTIAYQGADPSVWNNTAPTSDIFTTAGGSGEFFNTGNFIAYCFTSIAGYQKVGSYSGNQSLNTANQINFGFTPGFVLIKNTTNANSQWMLFDSVRTNGMALYANQANTEADYSTALLLSSQGLEFKSTNINVNQSGATYIYLAIKAN